MFIGQLGQYLKTAELKNDRARDTRGRNSLLPSRRVRGAKRGFGRRECLLFQPGWIKDINPSADAYARPPTGLLFQWFVLWVNGVCLVYSNQNCGRICEENARKGLR